VHESYSAMEEMYMSSALELLGKNDDMWLIGLLTGCSLFWLWSE